MEELKSFLESIGINQEEQKVYFVLLALADAPVSLIAQKSGVKRTTAYQILERLKQMGLASEYKSKGLIRYYAESPTKLKSSFEERLASINKLLPKLLELKEKTRIIPFVRKFEGKDGIRSIFEEALSTKEKIIYTIGSSQKLLDMIGKDFTLTRRRVAAGITSKAIRVKGEEGRPDYIRDQAKNMRQVRILPDSLKISGLLIFWDNTCGFISTTDEHFAFLTESKDLADSMKSMFNALWKISNLYNV